MKPVRGALIPVCMALVGCAVVPLTSCSVPPGCRDGDEAKLLERSSVLVQAIPGLTVSGMDRGSCDSGAPGSFDWVFSGTLAQLRRHVAESRAGCVPTGIETFFNTVYECRSGYVFFAEATEGDDGTIWLSVWIEQH